MYNFTKKGNLHTKESYRPQYIPRVFRANPQKYYRRTKSFWLRLSLIERYTIHACYVGAQKEHVARQRVSELHAETYGL